MLHRGEHRDGLTAFLNADAFTITEPSFELGEVVSEVTNGRCFHVDILGPHLVFVNLLNHD